MSIKVLIVDDHGILRSGIELIVEQTEDMEIVGQACDGHEGIELARKLKPDVVLMDISMPGLNGIEATKEIVRENSDIKVLALSAHCNRRFVKDMLQAGVAGYALKDSMADELIVAIRTVHDGQQYLCPKVASIIIAEYVTNGQPSSESTSADKLTAKERELIRLLADNMSNKEAARLLHVSVKTVDARRRAAMDKLGITGIAELTKFAIREGLTTLNN